MNPNTLSSDRKDYNWMLELFVSGMIILVLFFTVAIWIREG